jgi:hypothetical protein
MLVEKTKNSRDVTKTAGRVEHNHNRTTAGCYNINKTKPTCWWRKAATIETRQHQHAGGENEEQQGCNQNSGMEWNVTTIQQQQATAI